MKTKFNDKLVQLYVDEGSLELATQGLRTLVFGYKKLTI